MSCTSVQEKEGEWILRLAKVVNVLICSVCHAYVLSLILLG
jgi:hypothetical protein